MTVYVDRLCVYPQKAKSGGRYFGSGKQSCHMATDQDDPTELHELAERIGLRREWYQEHPTLGHYDLTPHKRAMALTAGAVAIEDRIEFVRKTSRLLRSAKL